MRANSTELFHSNFKKCSDPFLKIQDTMDNNAFCTIPGSPKRFALVVEDNFVQVKVMTRLLKRLGVRVEVAYSAIVALDRIFHHHDDFSVILMDIQMRSMTGIECTKLIRQFESENNKIEVPIFMWTANSWRGQESSEAGCNEYLLKPTRVTLLAECLTHHEGLMLPDDTEVTEALLEKYLLPSDYYTLQRVKHILDVRHLKTLGDLRRVNLDQFSLMAPQIVTEAILLTFVVRGSLMDKKTKIIERSQSIEEAAKNRHTAHMVQISAWINTNPYFGQTYIDSINDLYGPIDDIVSYQHEMARKYLSERK